MARSPTVARKPGKQPTNLSVDARLLAAARKRGINLSATLEFALAAEVRKRRRAEWLAVHRSAIQAYNEDVAAAGTFSDRLRKF